MDKSDVPHLGGTIQKTRAEIQEAVAKGGEDFYFSRHSIRNFSGDDVPMEDMRKAIRMARKTPSVCNRQGPRVYCFQNAIDALQWQPGNKGFGHLASRGLVVTSDLRAFTGTGERNQCWVDGGMFAMSILYALHSLGYGACPLAWAPEAAVDKKMRRALDIPDHQGVIMMIAVGVLPEKLNVAVADRYDLEDVLIER
nr:nitroreductase family protein [Aliiroseovarius sp. S1339]